MARIRSSSRWRWIHPSYYLRRPQRLALLFIGFVVVSFSVWDRQTLVREHKEEICKLTEELSTLRNQIRGLKEGLGDENLKTVGSSGESDESDEAEDSVNAERREKVKEAMLHAWNSYVKYAWGQDELQPQTKDGVNSFGGLGATLVDSLDTLYIMGLRDQFKEARDWVASSLDFNKDYDASVFETTIRVVGGLLSAYDLSGDKLFLQKAQDIANRLLPAWDTPTGIPYNSINLARGNAHNFGWSGVWVSFSRSIKNLTYDHHFNQLLMDLIEWNFVPEPSIDFYHFNIKLPFLAWLPGASGGGGRFGIRLVGG